MLEQKTEIIEFMESTIDIDEPIYGITWSPNPAEMPDADFYLQHNTNVELLASFLKCCETGVFCVESTQRGNPHYHGWYQVDPEKELARITMCKTLIRFGQLKITQLEHVKINVYTEKGNALYYYKKDLVGAMLHMEPNPITKDTFSTINFEILPIVGFLNNDTAPCQKIEEVISNRKFYRSFYSDTLSHVDYK